MATSSEDLNSRLFIKTKAYNVRLGHGVLSWCCCSSALTEKGHSRYCHSLKLKRVLAIVPYIKERFAEYQNDIELDTMNPINNYSSFFLHIIVKKENHKWINKKLHFNCGSTALGSKWITKIKQILSELGQPKSLLIFVNPHGGKKQAQKIFKNKVKPLFELAKIQMEVVETTQANHAKDFILNKNNLHQYDGIISVGGDGMFSEILNGVLLHGAQLNQTMSGTMFKPKKPAIKLGIIPAGSTNCVCYCTTGVIDPVTSTLQIITGLIQPMDISSICSGDELLRFSVSFAGYGFFGDVVQDSEKLRWVGVKRYDISGAKTFLANRSYEGELSYLISSDSQGHPRDKSKCRAGCNVCFAAQPAVTCGDLVPVESVGWHNTIGHFISVIGATNCCASDKSPEGISPSAHLADGCIDLVVVRHTSRVQNLRHMIRLAGRADHFDFDFVEVHRVKEFSFRPLPSAESEDDDDELVSSNFSRKNPERNVSLSRRKRTTKKRKAQRKSVWNVDGEIIEEPSVHVRVHRQLITLFANGIEECEKLTTCNVCRRR